MAHLRLGLESLAPETRPKTFVSLACLTGRAEFAKNFSQNQICRDLIAPFQSVHGAAASQFCQRLFRGAPTGRSGNPLRVCSCGQGTGW